MLRFLVRASCASWVRQSASRVHGRLMSVAAGDAAPAQPSAPDAAAAGPPETADPDVLAFRKEFSKYGDQNFRIWMQNYYRNPQPNHLPGALKHIAGISTQALTPPLLGFVAELCQIHEKSQPLVQSWFANLLAAPVFQDQAACDFLLRVLHQANTPLTRGILSAVLAQAPAGGTPEEKEFHQYLTSIQATPRVELLRYPIAALELDRFQRECWFEPGTRPATVYDFTLNTLSTKVQLWQLGRDGPTEDMRKAGIMQFDANAALAMYAISCTTMAMDLLWAGFYAHGNVAYVDRICQAARLWDPYRRFTSQAVQDLGFAPPELKDKPREMMPFVCGRATLLSLIVMGQLHDKVAARVRERVAVDSDSAEKRVLQLVLTEMDVLGRKAAAAGVAAKQAPE